MIVFPKEFVKTCEYGYFWNIVTKELYSIKIQGVMKKMKLQKAFRVFMYGKQFDLPKGYAISVNGRQKRMSLKYLMTLTVPDIDEVIEVIEEKSNA